jgi:glucose/arabinose dehydrogenase
MRRPVAFNPLAVALAAALVSPLAVAQANTQTIGSQLGNLRLTTIATGLQNPWGMAFLPDGNFLVTERPGRLRVVTPQGGVSTALTGVPAVFAQGQGGLLDIALDPQFASNRRVYLSFAEPGSNGTAGTAVFRAELNAAATGLVNGSVIFRAEPKINTTGHFGSRLAFGSDGFLYVTSGDNFSNATAQRQNQHQGKILRLRTDGSAAPDNPFIGNSAWRPEIWSTGHRSPQGLAFHPLTGQLWMSEHGPQGGDELNRVGRGLNYGWPTITFGIGYDGRPIPEAVGTSAAGLEQPQHQWTPSIGTSGLAIYTHSRAPSWIGSVFVGGLVSRSLHRLRLDANDRVVVQEQLMSGLNWRIRDVRVGPDGAVYALTDDSNGRVLRIDPPVATPRGKRPVTLPPQAEPPQSQPPVDKRQPLPATAPARPERRERRSD